MIALLTIFLFSTTFNTSAFAVETKRQYMFIPYTANNADELKQKAKDILNGITPRPRAPQTIVQAMDILNFLRDSTTEPNRFLFARETTVQNRRQYNDGFSQEELTGRTGLIFRVRLDHLWVSATVVMATLRQMIENSNLSEELKVQLRNALNALLLEISLYNVQYMAGLVQNLQNAAQNYPMINIANLTDAQPVLNGTRLATVLPDTTRRGGDGHPTQIAPINDNINTFAGWATAAVADNPQAGGAQANVNNMAAAICPNITAYQAASQTQALNNLGTIGVGRGIRPIVQQDDQGLAQKLLNDQKNEPDVAQLNDQKNEQDLAQQLLNDQKNEQDLAQLNDQGTNGGTNPCPTKTIPISQWISNTKVKLQTLKLPAEAAYAAFSGTY